PFADFLEQLVASNPVAGFLRHSGDDLCSARTDRLVRRARNGRRFQKAADLLLLPQQFLNPPPQAGISPALRIEKSRAVGSIGLLQRAEKKFSFAPGTSGRPGLGSLGAGALQFSTHG